MQLGDGFRGGRLDRIGDGDQPGKLAADGEEHHRLAVPPHRFGARRKRRGIDAGALHQALIAEQHLLPLDSAPHALAGDGGKALGLGGLDAARFGAAQDRFGKRMLAAGLDRGGEFEHIVLAEAWRRPRPR